MFLSLLKQILQSIRWIRYGMNNFCNNLAMIKVSGFIKKMHFTICGLNLKINLNLNYKLNQIENKFKL